jgi:uncharacterized protein YjdB
MALASAIILGCGGDKGDAVTITQPVTPRGVTSITVAPANLTISVHQTVLFVAAVIATEGVATSVNWTTSDAAVATIDGTGQVQGVAPGTTTVLATSTYDPSKKGVASLTVVP